MRLGFVRLDVGNGATFLAPSVVEQYAVVFAKQLVQQLLGHLRNAVHVKYAVVGKSRRSALGYVPKVGDGAVVPQRVAVDLLVQYANVVLGVLCRDVEGNFGKIQVATYADGGGDVYSACDFVSQLDGKLLSSHVVQRKVVRRIDEGLVDAVHVYVVGTDVV